MRETDNTPIRDPRNAGGLLTAVLELALAGPIVAKYPNVIADLAEIVKVGREFSKMPRSYTNGYKRRGGSSEFYQRIKKLWEAAPPGAMDLYLDRDRERRDAYGTAKSLADRILKVAVDTLEDMTRWEKFISETRIPARSYTNTPASIEPPEWRKAWLDHVSSAQRLGADLSAIATAECDWRFRDLTDRSHRGRNIRAAWEAAWLSGNYKFATQLISEVLA